MKEEKEYLYLKGTEELGDIVDAIKEQEAKEVVLVIPKNTKCLLHPTNLEILKHEANKHRKKIYFSTDDERLIYLAKQIGIEIFLEDFAYEEATKIVTDILPPQKTKPKITIKKEKPPSKKLSTKKILMSGLVILVGISAIFWFLNYSFSSATIEIILKKHKINFEEVILLNPKITTPDLENLSLPAEEIEITKTHTVKQPTSGAKSAKAKPTGKVKFINTDQENSISIIQGTRIKSSKGYIYRTVERVYLEPNGSSEVIVVAEEPSEIYQIENLDEEFTIPGLIGTYWENKIKVKLIEPILYAPQAKTVTIDDITQGKIKLEKELKEIVQNEIKMKYKDYIFPEELNIVDLKVTDIYPSVGNIANEVILTGTAKLNLVGVKSAVLKEFLKDLVAKNNLKSNYNLNIKSLNINSIKLQNFDVKNKIATVLVSGEIEFENRVDINKFKQEIVGKDLANVKEIINKYENIEKAEVSIRPFWVNYLPADPSKIEVKIK